MPRDHWLSDEEKRRIITFNYDHPLEGYRRLTYMMLDQDVVACSSTSVWRVLHQAGLLARVNSKPSRKGTGFVQPLGPHQHWHVDISYPVHGSSAPARSQCFSANLQDNICRCFKCGFGGNALDLWAKATGLSIYDAALDLCQSLGRPIPTRTGPRATTALPKTPEQRREPVGLREEIAITSSEEVTS